MNITKKGPLLASANLATDDLFTETEKGKARDAYASHDYMQ